LIRTGSRSSLLGLVVKPFLPGSFGKWLLSVERAKMVTRGRLSVHLQKAPQLSKEWGEGHYWLTETANATGRAYYEGAHNTRKLPINFTIQVPTGVSLVATQPIERPPQEFAARRYRDIRYWAALGRGGHFVAGEEPLLLAENIRSFFRLLR